MRSWHLEASVDGVGVVMDGERREWPDNIEHTEKGS